jgi:hypothetical protein
MSRPSIEAHRVRTPIQLMAVWFAALVLIEGAFLMAAVKFESLPWVAATLVIAAIVLVPVFLVAAIAMQTRFRSHLLSDEHYCRLQESRFHGFKAESAPDATVPVTSSTTESSKDEPEQRRIARYQQQEGLFLVHAWRPSRTPNQVADIVIWLNQHKAGPLTRGEVDRVEYYLGPMFFSAPKVKKNRLDAFKLEVSAYYPMLCLARVFLKGRSDPIELDRYIDFDVPASEQPEPPALGISGDHSAPRVLPPPKRTNMQRTS